MLYPESALPLSHSRKRRGHRTCPCSGNLPGWHRRHLQSQPQHRSSHPKKNAARIEREGLPQIPAPQEDTIEFDELCIRVTPSLWLWVAISRLVKHVLGFAIGGRTDEMLELAWSDVPDDYRDKPVATDFWAAYARFFGEEQHQPCEKGSGKTSIAEGHNTKWRHKHPGLNRRACGVHRRITTDLIERFYIVAEQHGIQAIGKYQAKLQQSN